MISLEDCFALSGLTRDEVLALAEHEHIPEIAAVALGQHLLNQPTGRTIIRAMIAQNIHSACRRGDMRHAEELAVTLLHFVTSIARRMMSCSRTDRRGFSASFAESLF